MWCRAFIWPKVGEEGAVDRTNRRTQTKRHGTRKTRQGEEKDTESPKQTCRFDFSPSSRVTGQAEWWRVGRE